MYNIYIISNNIDLVASSLNEYHEVSKIYIDNKYLKANIDDISIVDSIISNLILDFSLNVKVIIVPEKYNYNTIELLSYLSNSKKEISYLEDYLLYVLARSLDHELVNEIINGLINLDQEHFNTLKVYINTNGNVLKSSKLLYLHRNTLIYRLNKINDILNINLNKPKTIHCMSFILELI